MNKIKITFRTILIITIILTMIQMLAVNVYAVQGTFSVSASSSSIEVGGSTTVNVSANNCGGKFTLSSSNSSVASVSSSSEWVENGSASITVTGKAAGSTTITVTADDVANSDSSGIVTGSKSVTINVKAKEVVQQPADNSGSSSNSESSTTTKNTIPTETTTKPSTVQKSSNNYLKSLSVENGSLSPTFYRGTLEYNATFSDDVDVSSIEKVKINATAESSKASIKGNGDRNITDGENSLNIDVTAEDGSARTYTIKLTKPAKLTQSDLRLESLGVNKINSTGQIIKADLDKEFTADNFNYTMSVEKDIVSLDITTKVAKEGIIVTTNGDKNLVAGENTVTITLKSEKDSTIQTVYTIKVTKEQEDVAEVGETKPKSSFKFDYKMIPFIIGGIILLLIIALIILLIINHKQQKNKKSVKNGNGADLEENGDISFKDYVSKITNTEIDENSEEKDDSLKFDDNIINSLKTSITDGNQENTTNDMQNQNWQSQQLKNENDDNEGTNVQGNSENGEESNDDEIQDNDEDGNEDTPIKNRDRKHKGKHF